VKRLRSLLQKVLYPQQRTFSKCPCTLFDQIFRIKWLAQVCGSPGLYPLQGQFGIRVRGDHHADTILIFSPECPQQEIPQTIGEMVVQHGDVIFPIGETHRRFPAAVSHVLQISVLTKTFGQQAGQCLVVFHHKDPERLPGLFTGAYGMDSTFTCRGGNLGLAQHSGKTVILG